MRTRLLAAIMFLLSSMLALGQGKWSGRVKVIVSGDEQAAPLVGSYINSELRALGDVVVTDSQPAYRLSLIIVRTSGGYAISTLTDEYFNTKLYCAAISPPSIKSTFTDVPATDLQIVNLVAGHWIQTCPPLGLQQTVKELVAKFDVDTLQPSRNLAQTVHDLFDAQQKKQPQ